MFHCRLHLQHAAAERKGRDQDLQLAKERGREQWQNRIPESQDVPIPHPLFSKPVPPAPGGGNGNGTKVGGGGEQLAVVNVGGEAAVGGGVVGAIGGGATGQPLGGLAIAAVGGPAGACQGQNLPLQPQQQLQVQPPLGETPWYPQQQPQQLPPGCAPQPGHQQFYPLQQDTGNNLVNALGVGAAAGLMNMGTNGAPPGAVGPPLHQNSNANPFGAEMPASSSSSPSRRRARSGGSFHGAQQMRTAYSLTLPRGSLSHPHAHAPGHQHAARDGLPENHENCNNLVLDINHMNPAGDVNNYPPVANDFLNFRGTGGTVLSTSAGAAAGLHNPQGYQSVAGPGPANTNGTSHSGNQNQTQRPTGGQGHSASAPSTNQAAARSAAGENSALPKKPVKGYALLVTTVVVLVLVVCGLVVWQICQAQAMRNRANNSTEPGRPLLPIIPPTTKINSLQDGEGGAGAGGEGVDAAGGGGGDKGSDKEKDKDQKEPAGAAGAGSGAGDLDAEEEEEDDDHDLAPGAGLLEEDGEDDDADTLGVLDEDDINSDHGEEDEELLTTVRVSLQRGGAAVGVGGAVVVPDLNLPNLGKEPGVDPVAPPRPRVSQRRPGGKGTPGNASGKAGAGGKGKAVGGGGPVLGELARGRGRGQEEAVHDGGAPTTGSMGGADRTGAKREEASVRKHQSRDNQ
eukprot:g3895.t1